MKEAVGNLLGFFFIQWRRPFSVGDRIEIGDFTGDVIDTQLFQFLIFEVKGPWIDAYQSTGRIVHVPNNLLFIRPLVNFEKGFRHIWNELKVTVTFESNWEKAREILFEIMDREVEKVSQEGLQEMKEVARSHMVLFGKITPFVYVAVVESGVVLTLRYLTESRHQRTSEHKLWMSILKAFSESEDIEFAYPTTRFYQNHLGKTVHSLPFQ